ncbi:helix-hairpin-helix domain-containing protein [Nonomuraea sp. NPDC049309]|uniref:helix-hairpin-helix domain-containing protein n=1 Tax=Nonomuraea sp. NPDC049309 TaxID=3364350 RepID=UPI00371013E1
MDPSSAEEFAGQARVDPVGEFVGQARVDPVGEFVGQARVDPVGEFVGQARLDSDGRFAGQARLDPVGQFAGQTRLGFAGQPGAQTCLGSAGQPETQTSLDSVGEFAAQAYSGTAGEFAAQSHPDSAGQFAAEADFNPAGDGTPPFDFGVPPQRASSPAHRAQKAAPTSDPSPGSLQALREFLAAQSPTLDPGKPGLKALIAIGVLAVAVAGFLVWRSQPTPQPLPPPAPITSPAPVTSSASVTSPAAAAAKVTVHVTGKVRKPGVYLLAAGSRVTDAVTAAGGVSKGASTGGLNLARRLIDGEQIVVGAPSAQAAPGSPMFDPATAVLDLNSATADQLEQLPGVGEVLAARIVEFRTSRGGFTSVDQLREVSGIGPRKFEEIKPKVRV